jgi:hypothetical protein
MKTHPYLRAYMAGIAVPTPFLIVGVTGFTIARTTLRLPLARFAPFGIVVYYLAWKYLVGYLNEIMGIA